ncbi:MAG: hypothetical protein CMJ89_15145 [Planctomycetes bacterium]|jgi:polysaccharide export outer membrane protein|nr:hypothetical protein [Planctomycetota bacterium]
MTSPRRFLALLLAGWVVIGPWAVLSGCASYLPDKRLLQYLNQEGFGKRYVGDSQEQNYLSIGDTVTFIDTYNPEISATRQVDVDGTILVDQVGAVWVAGYTRSELESYLTQKLSPYYRETDIKVTITTGGRKVYYVLGQVTRKGAYDFTGDLTLFEAVLLASPKPNAANLGRVRLIRADPRNPLIIEANVSDLWERGDSTYNIPVKEYDIIFVPATFLQGIADFISSLFVPVISVFREVILAIFFASNPEISFGRGGRRQGF